jgi:hypothetical protein
MRIMSNEEIRQMLEDAFEAGQNKTRFGWESPSFEEWYEDNYE